MSHAAENKTETGLHKGIATSSMKLSTTTGPPLLGIMKPLSWMMYLYGLAAKLVFGTIHVEIPFGQQYAAQCMHI